MGSNFLLKFEKFREVFGIFGREEGVCGTKLDNGDNRCCWAVLLLRSEYEMNTGINKGIV